MCVYIYIYIYIERERCICISLSLYIYISLYICIYIYIILLLFFLFVFSVSYISMLQPLWLLVSLEPLSSIIITKERRRGLLQEDLSAWSVCHQGIWELCMHRTTILRSIGLHSGISVLDLDEDTYYVSLKLIRRRRGLLQEDLSCIASAGATHYISLSLYIYIYM